MCSSHFMECISRVCTRPTKLFGLEMKIVSCNKIVSISKNFIGKSIKRSQTVLDSPPRVRRLLLFRQGADQSGDVSASSTVHVLNMSSTLTLTRDDLPVDPGPHSDGQERQARGRAPGINDRIFVQYSSPSRHRAKIDALHEYVDRLFSTPDCGTAPVNMSTIVGTAHAFCGGRY